MGEAGLWWNERESVFVRGRSCVWGVCGAWDETEEASGGQKKRTGRILCEAGLVL